MRADNPAANVKFQSTLPCEERRAGVLAAQFIGGVSIHAPV